MYDRFYSFTINIRKPVGYRFVVVYCSCIFILAGRGEYLYQLKFLDIS